MNEDMFDALKAQMEAAVSALLLDDWVRLYLTVLVGGLLGVMVFKFSWENLKSSILYFFYPHLQPFGLVVTNVEDVAEWGERQPVDSIEERLADPDGEIMRREEEIAEERGRVYHRKHRGRGTVGDPEELEDSEVFSKIKYVKGKGVVRE